MHSIERYGIVALLFLVVTVVAVLMWDGNKSKKPDAGAGAVASATPPRARTAEPAAQSDAERRLSLVAESQPGPLQRNPRRARPKAEQVEPAPTAEPSALSAGDSELDGHDQGASADASRGQTPRERPAPEQVIGQTELQPAPALTAPPVAAATHAYTVRAGDTLSEIAQRELGSARRWQEIVAANPGLDPAKLRVGKTIQVPGAKSASSGAEVARASEPKAAPSASAKDGGKPAATPGGKTWKVGKGENLWRIAERALGDGKRWGEIARLNPKVDPNKLVLGQVLALPSSAKGSTAAPSKAKAKTSPVLVASAASERTSRPRGKVK